jgi:hypothetical protein
MPNWSGVELARALAETAKLLAARDSFGQTVEDIVAHAVEVVPGAEAAGLSLARNGTVETPAATHDLAKECDAAQYQTGQGPCLDAVWEDRVLVVNDMANETRWPRFAEQAAQHGVGSMLSCHLSSERGALSALNLYARSPAAFDEQSRTVALIYATHATIALEFARLETDLRAAVDTRQSIGQAVGIVMERHQIAAQQAFELLVRTSQRLNIKLRELAEVVVDSGIDPANTTELARLAGREAGDRAYQLQQQRRTDSVAIHGSTPEQLASASRRARTAKARATNSLHRAVEAKVAAAEAHERAALMHEKRATAERATAEYHERQAEDHRRSAEQARAAAKAELSELDELP